MALSTTPRGRHYPATPSTPSIPVPHSKVLEAPALEEKRFHGVWQDGQWWCNCEPRKITTLREVKKDGPNKGKLFWTCATRPSCNFFLWRDEAVVREYGFTPRSDADSADNQAVPPRPKTPSFTQKPLESYGIQITPSSRQLGILGSLNGVSEGAGSGSTSTQLTRETKALASVVSPTTSSPRRKRNRNGSWGEDEDEDEFTDLDSDEERQLAEITDRSVQKATPHRPSDNLFTTPPTNRRTTHIVGGLPTPSVSRNLFPASEAKRSKMVSFEEPSSSAALTTPPKTPSSLSSLGRIRPTSSSSDAIAQDVTEQVMTLLSSQDIDPAVLHSVQTLLSVSVRKTKGLSMGRDAARAALKEKDKKISQLQEKIRDLENQAAYDHKKMTNMKAQLIRMYEEN